ncbi:hypothetical protein [Candidatus Lokiarchaeum ossiferum]|uniref:hypothetical protein n=1 Tax=Candidatus Lokiarchaeum ossiferum TaxID=2951803 RepID=UPI00352E3B74
MENKYVDYKRKKRSSKRKASEGMTAAIILIAFIITAAGIAFVILTMGASMQLELGRVGNEGSEASSSAMQIDGGLIVGTTDANTLVNAYAFNIKLVLTTGQVDLSDDALTVWISTNHTEELQCIKVDFAGETADAASTAADGYASTYAGYDIVWKNAGGATDVLEGNEMARFIIGSGVGAAESEEVLIVINSGVATIKIELLIPIGLVASAANIMQ